jgi:Ca-activated chloride channel homolog
MCSTMRLRVALLVAFGVVLSLTQTSAGGQATVFRIGADLVPLTVTVSDQKQGCVTDLTAADFTVFENGRPQTLSFFDRATVPMALSILVDSSASMEMELATAQAAAASLVTALRPGDVASIIDFDSRVSETQEFTNDKEALPAGLANLQAGGSTSLYNAVYVAIQELKRYTAKTPDVARRSVIVVLSEGDDTSSLLTFDDILDFVRQSGIVTYTIRLQSTPFDSSRRAEPLGPYVLQRLASTSGGRNFVVSQTAQLAAIYAQIGRELACQYVLAYVPTDQSRDEWRSISVRVARNGAVARAREGYLARRRP